VAVYEQRPGPDGLTTGCPHVHGICAEAYYVLEGSGHVELHDLERGLYRVDLEPGAYLQFPPNVMHRLVSEDGLVILGIMSNAGLAENGDARIYFGKAIDTDTEAYNAAVGLVTKGLMGALERRDLAVKGYQELLQLWKDDRDAYFEELDRFMRLHRENVESDPSKYLPYVEQGPKGWGHHTESLLTGTTEDKSGNPVIRDLPEGEPRFGMCGILHPVRTENALQLNNQS
jgi:mannose-6-phosphate isomerase-like protein (cupin superfamily)